MSDSVVRMPDKTAMQTSEETGNTAEHSLLRQLEEHH